MVIWVNGDLGLDFVLIRHMQKSDGVQKKLLFVDCAWLYIHHLGRESHVLPSQYLCYYQACNSFKKKDLTK